jgi:hypothetical protein
MKNNLTKREYVVPTLRVVPLTVENQFLASQLDDYDDNPIFSDPTPWGEEL